MHAFVFKLGDFDGSLAPHFFLVELPFSLELGFAENAAHRGRPPHEPAQAKDAQEEKRKEEDGAQPLGEEMKRLGIKAKRHSYSSECRGYAESDYADEKHSLTDGLFTPQPG